MEADLSGMLDMQMCLSRGGLTQNDMLDMCKFNLNCMFDIAEFVCKDDYMTC